MKRVAIFLLLLLAAVALVAQTSSSSLAGRVADESGAALPGVTVMLKPLTKISRLSSGRMVCTPTRCR